MKQGACDNQGVQPQQNEALFMYRPGTIKFKYSATRRDVSLGLFFFLHKGICVPPSIIKLHSPVDIINNGFPQGRE